MRPAFVRAVLSVLGGGACAFIASIPPSTGARGFPARISCNDSVAPPGEPVRARAKLERLDGFGIHPDLPGERIVFLLGGEAIASTDTDESGNAYAELRLGPGLYELRVAADASRYDVAPASFHALVLDEGERLLVLAFEDDEAAGLLRPRGPVASFGEGGDIALSKEEAMRLGEHVIAFVRDESESAVWRASGARVLVWKNGIPAELQGLLERQKER